MAKDKSKEYGAQGGRKRAALLSPEERRRIAVEAAEARWGQNVPRAMYGSPDRPIRLGGIDIQCYVLEDERRVLVQRGLQSGIGMSTSGGSGGAQRMARFIASLEAKGIDTNNLSARMMNPILFRPMGFGKTAYGFEAKILVEICRAVLEARQAEKLVTGQKEYARHCELLLGGLAEKGIEALVDEATGYRVVRAQDEVARVLSQFIQKEFRKWVPTFPLSFFQELCRLRDIPFPDNMQLPQYFGHDINRLVWDRLAPGVREELQRLNPVVEGRRKHRHHQFLTDAIGHPRLLHHLGLLEGLARGFGDGDFKAFNAAVERALPNYAELPLFASAAKAERKKLTASASTTLKTVPSDGTSRG